MPLARFLASAPGVLDHWLGPYRSFIQKVLQGGFRAAFTKPQLAKACRRAGLTRDPLGAEIRYVQWLCLFRCYWEHVLGKGIEFNKQTRLPLAALFLL
jgi:23S rRNA (adenine-N6)-dimethyltransferase